MGQVQWSESDAKRVLAAVARSGMSFEAFGRANKISPKRLYWWRKRLRDEQLTCRTPAASALVPTSKAVTFVELAAEPEERSAPIEIVLGNGRTVRVPPSFDDRVLTRVLAAADGVA